MERIDRSHLRVLTGRSPLKATPGSPETPRRPMKPGAECSRAASHSCPHQLVLPYLFYRLPITDYRLLSLPAQPTHLASRGRLTGRSTRFGFGGDSAGLRPPVASSQSAM